MELDLWKFLFDHRRQHRTAPLERDLSPEKLGEWTSLGSRSGFSGRGVMTPLPCGINSITLFAQEITSCRRYLVGPDRGQNIRTSPHIQTFLCVDPMMDEDHYEIIPATTIYAFRFHIMHSANAMPEPVSGSCKPDSSRVVPAREGD